VQVDHLEGPPALCGTRIAACSSTRATEVSNKALHLPKAMLRPPYRNALVVIAIAVAMASVFAVSYSLALGARRRTGYRSGW
jgi:hypothetical protein